MSTKPVRLARLCGLVLGGALAGCAASSPPVGPSAFSAVRFGPRSPAPQVEATPGASAPASSAVRDPLVAARRVDAYLTALGFAAEDSRDGAVRVVTATRMAEPKRLETEADCTLEALRRPDFSAANLTVRLAPAAAGVDVAVQSSFVEVNTNLLSGALARERCRSRGVLERGVRRAALGG